MTASGNPASRWTPLALVVACTSCLGLVGAGAIAVAAGVIGVFWASLLPAVLIVAFFGLWVSGMLAPSRAEGRER